MWVRRTAVGAGLLMTILFVGLTIASLHCFMPTTDGLEADILAIAAASRHGQPIYHSATSPEYSYSTCYGPLAFLIYRVGLALGGGRFWVLRAMIVAANLLIVWGLFRVFRKGMGSWSALALMAFPLSMLMEHIRYAFGFRADIWIVLSIVLGVQATMMESPLAAAVLAGVCAGLGVDFKVTVGVAGVLLLWMVFQRSGVRYAAIGAGMAVVTTLLPFAIPGVSLIHYVQWLRIVGHQGVSPSMFKFCWTYAAVLILPLAMLWVMGFRPQGRGVRSWSNLGGVLLVGGIAVVALVASKPGGGVWHFWQVIPIECAYLAAVVGTTPTVGSAKEDLAILIVALGGLAIGLSFLQRDIAVVQEPKGLEAEMLHDARHELKSYQQRYSGRTIEMGYGDSRNQVESLRYILVNDGQPYTLDGSQRLDVFAEPFPQEVLAKMDHCVDDVWLIPHGEMPFEFTYVFPQALHDTFESHYAIAQQGAALDAWVCKAH